MSYKQFRLPFCENCGANQNLTAHHVDPASKGQEQKHDIVTLCIECHNELNVMVVKGWFAQETAHFEMWLHDNRKYTKAQHKPKLVMSTAKSFRDLGKIFGLSRAKIGKMLVKNGLATYSGSNGAHSFTPAKKRGVMSEDGLWNVEKLIEIMTQ